MAKFSELLFSLEKSMLGAITWGINKQYQREIARHSALIAAERHPSSSPFHTESAS